MADSAAEVHRNTAQPPLQLVQSYLDRYGWRYEVLGPDAIITGFSGDDAVFVVLLRVADQMLYMSVRDYAKAPLEEQRAGVFAYLLEANYDMALTKFGVDEQGMIVMTAELPVGFLSYDLFLVTLYFLCFNANEHLPLVRAALTNPESVPAKRVPGSAGHAEVENGTSDEDIAR